MDEIDEYVAWLRVGLARGVDERKVFGRPAFGPDARTLGPLIQRLRQIGGRQLVVASLQPRINHIASEIGYGRKVLRLGEHGADALLAQERDEARCAETRRA